MRGTLYVKHNQGLLYKFVLNSAGWVACLQRVTGITTRTRANGLVIFHFAIGSFSADGTGGCDASVLALVGVTSLICTAISRSGTLSTLA